jgi:CheY-like chemotaxis protein
MTDYNMPGMSGIDVAREVLAINPALPVAVASGYISDELQAEAAAAGVTEVVFKTDAVEAFCEIVATSAGQARQRLEPLSARPTAPAPKPSRTGAVHVAAAQGDADGLASQHVFFLHRRGESGCARAFGHVVGVGEDRAHGLGHFVVGDLHDVVQRGASIASASASATRQAMPSASRVVTGASTTRPAAIESA